MELARYVAVFVGTFILVFLGIRWVQAINTVLEGWQLAANTSTKIDTASVWGDCKTVVTPNNGKTLFVPTKTVAEWNAFKAAAPGLSVTLNSCCASNMGSACWDEYTTYGSCTAPYYFRAYTCVYSATGEPCPGAQSICDFNGTVQCDGSCQ